MKQTYFLYLGHVRTSNRDFLLKTAHVQSYPQLYSRTPVAAFPPPPTLFPSPVDPTDLTLLTSFLQLITLSQPPATSGTTCSLTGYTGQNPSRLPADPQLSFCFSRSSSPSYFIYLY